MPNVSFQQIGIWLGVFAALLSFVYLLYKVDSVFSGRFLKRTDFDIAMKAKEVENAVLKERVDNMQRALSAGAEARQEKLLLYLEKFLEKRHRR